MASRPDTVARQRRQAPAQTRPRRAGRTGLRGGGPDGNEILTTLTGLVLIAVLLVLGLTIVRIGQLLWLHLFVGLLVIGPVALKIASTGYRFVRYYSGNAAYVEKGPPWTPLRLLAPIVVLSTVVVLATGIVLLAVGPVNREPWLLLHKASFVIWLGATALHVLGHLPEVSRMLGLRAEILNLPGIRTDLERFEYERAHLGEDTPPTAAAEARTLGGPGSSARITTVGISLVAGLVIAIILIPDFHAWTSWLPVLTGDH